MANKLSIVIITYNEEGRLADCIKSVETIADEIIVVDDESTDNTRGLAQELGAKVFVRKMDIEGRHRNWAYAQATNDWVYSLDADERMTPELCEEIKELLSGSLAASAYTMPRKNFLGEYWLRWGGQYPAAQIKLFHKDQFRWEEKADVHPRAFIDGDCEHLTKDLIHFTYRNLEDALKKLNSQTTKEAIKWTRIYDEDPRKASHKMNLPHAIWRTMDRFCRSYIGKKGYRDGFVGFIMAYYSSVYQMVSYAKYVELLKQGFKNKK